MGSAASGLGARVDRHELFSQLARRVVGPLVLRRLHELGGRPVELAGDAVVQRKLRQRTALMTMPAELGESLTSSLISKLSGTLPKAWHSMRMCVPLPR